MMPVTKSYYKLKSNIVTGFKHWIWMEIAWFGRYHHSEFKYECSV